MGIKSLTQSIKKCAPDSIVHDNLYKLTGKRVAVDASLIIYQQLLRHQLLKNKKGEITNHITGLFYKLTNYLSLNIEVIFVFDGKPPDLKQECIKVRKKKVQDAKDKMESCENIEQKNELEKSTLRLTKDMIDNVKKLLNLMGISYIHMDVGEGEAIAAELCRIGYVDYVLTEDMDTLVYGSPKLIRNCLDKSLKRKDIVSIIDYNEMMKGFEMTDEQFVKFCILCGCDYCTNVPKVGNTTALKMIKKHNTIENIIEEYKNKYEFPEGYAELFNKSYDIFMMYRDKLNVDELNVHKSNKDVGGLIKFMVNDIEMNELRVQKAVKKLQNTLGNNI
jgi:flap endonuclease-1